MGFRLYLTNTCNGHLTREVQPVPPFPDVPEMQVEAFADEK